MRWPMRSAAASPAGVPSARSARAIVARDERAVRGVERHQRDLAEAGGEHDRRRLRIGPDVELGRRRDVADLVPAAHDRPPPARARRASDRAASAAAMLVSGATGTSMISSVAFAIGLDQELDRAGRRPWRASAPAAAASCRGIFPARSSIARGIGKSGRTSGRASPS